MFFTYAEGCPEVSVIPFKSGTLDICRTDWLFAIEFLNILKFPKGRFSVYHYIKHITLLTCISLLVFIRSFNLLRILFYRNISTINSGSNFHSSVLSPKY